MKDEDIFWEWFNLKSQDYLLIDSVDDYKREFMLDEFLEHLHEYSDNLYFMMGQNNNKGELVITAAGDSDYFLAVEKLVNAAPKFREWDVIAFKQPTNDEIITNFEGAEIDSSKSWFLDLGKLRNSGISIRILTDNYNEEENENFISAAYELLDSILGEKSNALLINHIEVAKLPENFKEKDIFRLSKLKNYIELKTRNN